MSTHSASRRFDKGDDRTSSDIESVTGRTSRHSAPRIEPSSLATVRQLLREVRKLEDEVRDLSDDNADLLRRMEDLMAENDSLRSQMGGKRVDVPIDGALRSTRRAWEELDERESTQATTRNRSVGQRSNKSSVSSERYFRPGTDFGSGSDNESIDIRNRKSSNASNASASRRMSTGGLVQPVIFDGNAEVIPVTVDGAMRPSRSRVSTPFFSDEAISTLKTETDAVNRSSEDCDDVTPQTVNFDDTTHVVKVVVGNGDEPLHARSIRGRIATPFIRDVNTTTDPSQSEPATNNPE